MTLSVGAISNSYKNFNYVKNHSRQNNTNAMNANPSFGGTKNKLRNAAIGTVALVTLPAAMTSCDKDWLNHSEATAIAIANCHHHICNKPDTIYIPVPGKNDTIVQIVENHDTIKVKDDFKSPVIDSINAILDDLDIDHDGGYIPLKISFIDEMDNKYKKYLFDGDATAPDQVLYRGKKSPYDDVTGKFLIGTPLDESENYLASLTSDGKLYLMRMIPKNGVTDPKSLDDFMMAPQSVLLSRDNAAKVIRKLGVYSDKSGREDLGYMEKGEQPKMIKHTNQYGTNWRYTNFDVVAADAPEGSNK